MSRIQLNDTTTDVLVKMSDGNPGALACLMEIMSKATRIDPQGAMGGLGPILSLDTHGIYGTDIYVLWSDVCDKSTPKMLAVLRACQLGLFNPSIVADASSRQDYSGVGMVPVEELYTKVKERLPRFDTV